ncbi:hypothetical protein MPER_06834, partial [Moniliophthora perniciosa FA553]
PKAEILGLQDPPISWHVARDGIAECVSFLSIIGGTLGKIALDLLLLSSSEFGEVQEPFVPHRGASSTMPQKRNSISSEVILACSKLLRQHASTAQDAMVSDLERASGPWHLEWSCVPEAFCAASGALKQTEFVLDGLVVDTQRMLQNLDMSKGLIVGEAIMMGLAPSLGRNAAHDVVYEACKSCIEEVNSTGEQGRLSDKLKSMPQVRAKMDEGEIDRLGDALARKTNSFITHPHIENAILTIWPYSLLPPDLDLLEWKWGSKGPVRCKQVDQLGWNGGWLL